LRLQFKTYNHEFFSSSLQCLMKVNWTMRLFLQHFKTTLMLLLKFLLFYFQLFITIALKPSILLLMFRQLNRFVFPFPFISQSHHSTFDWFNKYSLHLFLNEVLNHSYVFHCLISLLKESNFLLSHCLIPWAPYSICESRWTDLLKHRHMA